MFREWKKKLDNKEAQESQLKKMHAECQEFLKKK